MAIAALLWFKHKGGIFLMAATFLVWALFKVARSVGGCGSEWTCAGKHFLKQICSASIVKHSPLVIILTKPTRLQGHSLQVSVFVSQ